VEVDPAVAPPVEVDAGDAAQGEDSPLDPRCDPAEVAGDVVGEIGNESTWTRLASQTAPGRLPPTGGCNVQFASDQTALVVAPAQIAQGGPPGSPRRRGSGICRSAGSRATSGS
jgi:hypothetical protein